MLNYKDSLGKALGFTLRMYSKNLQAKMEGENIAISVEQFVLLNIVQNHKNQEITQIDLANIVGKDKSAVLRHIDHLEQMKLIGRAENINDRRKKILKLTQKGVEQLKKVQIMEQKLTQSVMKGMSKSEKETFMQQMDQILNNILKLENS